MKLLKPFIFKTKAQTLVSLRDQIIHSSVPNIFVFTVQAWINNRSAILNSIAERYSHCIVRSSTTFEDSHNSSGAGEFDSILNVDSQVQAAVEHAIGQVIDSYKVKIPIDYLSDQEILVQEMINNVSMSGVVFTYEVKTGAPYYVVNYDDVTGRTDTVTSGEGEFANRTLYIYKNSTSSLRSSRFQNLVAAVDELETKLGRKDLDVEFACDRNDIVHLFQVRPIVGGTSFSQESDRKQNSNLAIWKLI